MTTHFKIKRDNRLGAYRFEVVVRFGG